MTRVTQRVRFSLKRMNTQIWWVLPEIENQEEPTDGGLK
jgi:hypothetical protein